MKLMYQIIMKLESILPCRLFFKLLKLFSKCKECYDGYFHPYYGLAPHDHPFDDKGRIIIGGTIIRPKSKWPDNFEEDPEVPGLGTYHCPKCKYSDERGFK